MTKQPKRQHRTRYGEGSFKWNEKRRLWVGRWDTGEVTERGRRIIITTSSRDENTAWDKFTALKKDWMLSNQAPDLKPSQTVQGWAKIWLPRHIEDTAASTWKTDRSNLKNWVLPQVGGKRLSDMGAGEMRKVGTAALKAGRSGSAAHSAQRTLLKLLNAAVAEGYTVPERALKAKKVSIGETGREAMPVEALKRVLTEARKTMPDWIFVLMLVVYGSRKNELLGLTWDRVLTYEGLPAGAMVVGEIDLTRQLQALPYDDRAAGTFKIPQGRKVQHLVGALHLVPPKTEAGVRALPLLAPVAAALEEWRQVCPTGDANPFNLVFPRIRGRESALGWPRNDHLVLQEWKDLQAAAGVYKKPGEEGRPPQFFVLHEARHSMISILAEAQVPKHLIEMLVGQTELVRDYVHGSLATAGDALAGAMGDLLPVVDAGEIGSA